MRRLTDLGFLICVEHGRLENEGVLLAESIRRWGGGAADAAIYAFSPRPDFQPEAETVARLEALDVTHVTEPLIPEAPGGPPTFNKVFVSAWAERELDHETLVFTDTDAVVLGEPTALMQGDWVAAARPVDRRIAGSRGKGKNEPYWRRMYEALGVSAEPFVETTVGKMRIRAYWNSGLLAARRSAGLFGAWEAALKTLHERDLVYHRMPQFMDQLSWAAVTADHHDRMLILPDAYNYPLRQRGGLPDEARELDLSEIVHLHYRLFFHLPDPLGAASPPFDPDSEQYAWLIERLPIDPIVDEAYSE
jgi:hypothetical protein